MTGPLSRIVADHRIILILGSGGVGKTTSAVTLAVLGALSGKKVGLLSIDPARRLADAMGIKLGYGLEKVAFSAEAGVTGELWATMLDQKEVFDEMVRRFAPSEKIGKMILENSIYKAASSKLGGPLEYMAIARLEEMASDPSYDLIVLDTPPDTHALDFLVRPNILSGFTENKVMSWLVKPLVLANKLGRGPLLGVSEKIVSGLSKVTGLAMLRKLAEFLILIEDIIQGFQYSGERVAKLLHDPTTAFVLVTAPTGASVRSTVYMAQRLMKEGFKTRQFIVNRCTPASLRQAFAAHPETALDGWQDGLEMMRATLALETDLLARLASEVKASGMQLAAVRIPEQTELVHSTEAILELARVFAAAS